MPRKLSIPSYRQHRGSGQAFVQVAGRRHYLGVWGSAKSKERYSRFIAELAAKPPEVVTATAQQSRDGLLMVQLLAAYWRFAQGYYVKDGQPTAHLHLVRRAIQVCRELYANVPVTEFGPLALRAIQQHLVKAGNSRGYINRLVGTIRRMFKWGVSQQLLPETIHRALATAAKSLVFAFSRRGSGFAVVITVATRPEQPGPQGNAPQIEGNYSCRSLSRRIDCRFRQAGTLACEGPGMAP